MSKKHGKKQSQTPRPGELLGQKPKAVAEQVAEQVAEVEAKVEAPKAEAEAPAKVAPAVSTLQEILANLPEEVREKAQAELDKLLSQVERSKQSKQWVAFDEELKNEESGLPKWLGDLAEKHGVDLSGRRITITYPDGKFAYTNSPKGSRSSGNGSRDGFPEKWGDAELVGKDGKVQKKAASPSKLAEVMNLQVEGMRNMPDVFENPHERGTKKELEKIYRVDAVRGEHFRVIIK